MVFSKIPVFGMILQSGPFARGILLFLVLFSILSWAVIITKWVQRQKNRRNSKRFFRRFNDHENLGAWLESYKPEGESATERLAMIAAQEYQRIQSGLPIAKASRDPAFYLTTHFGVLQSEMDNALAREIENRDWGLTFLAVSTSISPFVGLLGTVWGIAHSFYEIGSMGSASVNVVAPGIAEALITTILGLVVAIPCGFFYNIFLKQLRQLETELMTFCNSLVSEVKSFLVMEVNSK